MYYGWYLVSACMLISAYYSGVVYLGFTAAFEPLVTEFGWSYAQVSFVTSLRGLETGLLVPVAGVLMDRWGPRRIVMAGALVAGVGMICLSQVNTLLKFYASFLLIAAGLSTATSTLLMAAVTSWFDKRVGLATGITASGVSIGGLLIPFVTRMIDGMGWREAMIIMGIGMWVIPLPLSLLLRHRPEDYGYQPDGIKSALSGGVMAANGRNCGAAPVPVGGAREALKSPLFWLVSLVFMCQALPVGAIVTHIMPFFSTVGITRAKASVIASMLPIMTVVGRVGFGWLGDKVGKKEVTVLALAFTAIGSLIFAWSSPERMWVIYIFVVVFGIGWGGSVPMLNGMLREYFGTAYIGSLMGFAGSVLMVAMMVGSPFAGWVFDETGRYQPAWYLISGIVAIATVVFIKYAKRPT
jgi:MFS family permease